jgi:ureidoglycolate hydrolase
MTRLFEITLESVSAEAFRPFGELLKRPDTPSLGERDVQDYWRLPFDLDGKPELEIVRYWAQPWELNRVERHLHVTESRVALGGRRVVLVVAPRTPGEIAAGPAPESLRAFLIDDDAGVLLHRGTWHALDCFPVDDDFVDFAFLTEAETVAELEGVIQPNTPPRTEVFDFETLEQRFRVVDPTGLKLR